MDSDSDDTKIIGIIEEQTYGLGSICGFDASHERSFFLMIMTLIFCSLCARVIFLTIIFVRKDWQYYYGLFTEQGPTIFKLLTVINICKYKLNTYYVASFQRAKP